MTTQPGHEIGCPRDDAETVTRDVLVHTWDLARAVGADDRLDAGWCEHFYAALPTDPQGLSGSGMFDNPVR